MSALLIAAGEIAPRDLSIFAPASPGAQSIVSLAMLVLAVAALIFLVVEGILFYTIWRFRSPPPDATSEPPQVYGSQPIEVAWTAAPTVIVFFLVLVTARTLWEVNTEPVAAAEEPGQDGTISTANEQLDVTVVGRQWWWEYRYQRYGARKLSFITANELHIPASEAGQLRPTRLSLESADVCHSYWVPRLEGKVDLIPGQTNTLWLNTAEPGLYLGQCAEYCGTQHAHMLIRVVVDTPADFERWLDEQERPADAASDSEATAGRQAFLQTSCVNCHRVRGTSAAGTFGPDLTHLMSRQTLAAGMFENNRENLAQWVRDPQTLKPGCLMPAFGLSPGEEDRIVNYLMTLR